MSISAQDTRLQKVGFCKLVGENIEFYAKKYEINIGRKTKAGNLDIVIGDANISRHHATIAYSFEKGAWELQVFGKNGVTLKNIVYSPKSPAVTLQSGDLLQLGDKAFFFLLEKGARARQKDLMNQKFQSAISKPKPMTLKILLAEHGEGAETQPAQEAAPREQTTQQPYMGGGHPAAAANPSNPTPAAAASHAQAFPSRQPGASLSVGNNLSGGINTSAGVGLGVPPHLGELLQNPRSQPQGSMPQSHDQARNVAPWQIGNPSQGYPTSMASHPSSQPRPSAPMSHLTGLADAQRLGAMLQSASEAAQGQPGGFAQVLQGRGLSVEQAAQLHSLLAYGGGGLGGAAQMPRTVQQQQPTASALLQHMRAANSNTSGAPEAHASRPIMGLSTFSPSGQHMASNAFAQQRHGAVQGYTAQGYTPGQLPPGMAVMGSHAGGQGGMGLQPRLPPVHPGQLVQGLQRHEHLQELQQQLAMDRERREGGSGAPSEYTSAPR